MNTAGPPLNQISPEDAAKGIGVALTGLYMAWRWVTKNRISDMHDDIKAEIAHLHECLHNIQSEMDKGFEKAEKRIDRLEERIDDVMLSRLGE